MQKQYHGKTRQENCLNSLNNCYWLHDNFIFIGLVCFCITKFGLMVVTVVLLILAPGLDSAEIDSATIVTSGED